MTEIDAPENAPATDTTEPNPPQIRPKRLLFLDTETTGLDPEVHEPYELSWALADVDFEAGELRVRYAQDVFIELTYKTPYIYAPELQEALEVGRFHERYEPDRAVQLIDAFAQIVMAVADKQADTYLTGFNPRFDEDMIVANLGLKASDMPWSHRRWDLTPMIGGFDAGGPFSSGVGPWTPTRELAAIVGVDTDMYERHTAKGDVAITVAVLAQMWGMDVVA